MAGYTRQSIADIINGADVTAPPLNAEFDQLSRAFDGSTGHSHDGTTGNAPKIDLTTSVTGFLPAIHGGIGGKNNFAATANPTVTDDSAAGYAPGSMWENTTTGRVFICVGNTSGAAVWRELVQVISSNQITPETTNTVDLGTPATRFQDLWLSGSISAATNVSIGGTLSVSGASTLASLNVTGASTLDGNITLGNTTLDTITVTGRVNSDIIPTGVQDLGTPTEEWNDLFIDGTAHIDTLDVDENANVDGNLLVTGNTSVIGTLGVTGDATMANLTTTGTTVINSIDLASGAIDNSVIGNAIPAAGTFTTLTANTSLTAATADINGGTIDGATVGATTPSTGAFTTLSTSGAATLASADINGGSIDNTTIGATSPASGKFTTLQSTGNATLATADINGGTIDGTAIGATAPSSGAFTTVSASGGLTGDLTGDVDGNVTGDVQGNVTGNLQGDVTGNVTAATGSSTFNNVTINGSLDMNAGTTATITNLTSPTNTNDAATKGYVDTSIASLVDSAPGTLDTLNELAAALGDDPNFSTTITNSIATKLPLAGGTMTGAIAMGTSKITGLGDPTAAQDAATKAYVDTQDALQVSKSGDSMSGNLAMGSNNITGLATPTANDHAANKSYVDGVLGSATDASASAAAAAVSEANAATSETNAANSASAAASSATSAAASLDSFDDRYLGAKASAPTVDNDGDPLIIGALYFDTGTNTMKVYGGSGWVNAGSSVNGTSDRQTYIASAGQTVFAATYDAGYVDVYLNGVKLLAGTDFTATNGTSITLASGAAVNDVVDIVAYGTFVLADHLTETQSDAKYVEVAGDTMTGDLDVQGTITSDGLNVDGTTTLTGDFNVEGSTDYGVEFRGTVNTVDSIKLQSRFRDDTNAAYYGGANIEFIRDGNWQSSMTFDTAPDYSNRNGLPRLRISNNGDISFYEDTGTTAKFFWDASAERLGLGTSSPDAAIHSNVSTAGNNIAKFSDSSNNRSLIVQSVTAGMEIITTEEADETDSDRSLIFKRGNTETMRIDSSGNVGIGTSSPQTPAHISVALSGNNVLRVENTTSGFGAYTQYKNVHNPGNALIGLAGDTSGDLNIYQGNASNIKIYTSGSERMRIDSSGNLLVGKTTPNSTTVGVEARSSGILTATRDSNTPVFFGRNTTDGDIVVFQKGATTVGSIGTRGGVDLYIGSGDTNFKFAAGSDAIVPATIAGADRDNAIDLGISSVRFDDIYATNGTIQTSDQNEKQDIAELTGAEITAAKAISKLFKTFKWNDSVAEKGDAARTHTGVIAQEVEQAMTDAGLDAGDYAFFISTTWWETQTEVPAVEADEENGVEAQEAYTRTDTYETLEEAPEGATERNRKGIRYPQLLSFIGAATEQRLASIESRLDALEAN